MKVKICKQCGEPFAVVEDGGRTTEIENGALYLGASAETCLDCDSKAKARRSPRTGG